MRRIRAKISDATPVPKKRSGRGGHGINCKIGGWTERARGKNGRKPKQYTLANTDITSDFQLQRLAETVGMSREELFLRIVRGEKIGSHKPTGQQRIYAARRSCGWFVTKMPTSYVRA